MCGGSNISERLINDQILAAFDFQSQLLAGFQEKHLTEIQVSRSLGAAGLALQDQKDAGVGSAGKTIGLVDGGAGGQTQAGHGEIRHRGEALLAKGVDGGPLHPEAVDRSRLVVEHRAQRVDIFEFGRQSGADNVVGTCHTLEAICHSK